MKLSELTLADLWALKEYISECMALSEEGKQKELLREDLHSAKAEMLRRYLNIEE